MSVDGIDVIGHLQLTGGRLTYRRRRRSRSASTPSSPSVRPRRQQLGALTWTFTVRDEMAPTVCGRLPVAGTTVAGAVPIGFDVADTGTGIDPSSLQVLVDGSDVTSWGAFEGGHFRYAPGDLGAGVHTIAVTVADAAGNVAGPLMWQFAVADPATLSRAPWSAPVVARVGGRRHRGAVRDQRRRPLAGARCSSPPGSGSAGFGAARTWVADVGGTDPPADRARPHHRYHVELADHPTVRSTSRWRWRRRVSLAAGRGRCATGTALRLSGTVEPLAPGGRVTVQLLTGRGWVTVAHPGWAAGRRFTAWSCRGCAAGTCSGCWRRHGDQPGGHEPHRRGAGSLSPPRVRAARQQPLARTRRRPPTSTRIRHHDAGRPHDDHPAAAAAAAGEH